MGLPSSSHAAPSWLGRCLFGLRSTTSGNALPLEIAALAILYAVTARFGLTIHPVDRFACLIWLPTGLAIAALIWRGPRLWPGIALGAFAANFFHGAPVWAAMGIA